MYISGVTWVVMAKKIFFDGEDLHNTQENVKIGKNSVEGMCRGYRWAKAISSDKISGLPPSFGGGRLQKTTYRF